MLLLRTIFAAIPLAAFTHAASNDSAPPFEITNLTIRKHASTNVTIEFTVYDPDPLTKATAVCSGSWTPKSKEYPHGSYEPCGNSSFAWHMESYDGIRSFVLGIEHVYEDPAVGEPPYDQITNFGQANVTEPAIVCRSTSGLHICEQDKGTTINAPITATIAKRR